MSKKASVITLNIAGNDIRFEPNMIAYNGFINEMAMDNKVAPAHTYLNRIVAKEDKEALGELLELPGAALQIATTVNDQYAPKLDISVKN
ncbi:putative phage tail assembly chaperone [Morganella morganii]|uniref:putative phage tail assembly chaperone n=1 Tax=Morganella morganii TaxID=582 RepID=UPI001BDA8E69|nr:putative phage tail assembly chaperone [Morganella morganii]EMD0829335.1 putative phage tail assembly chaperone [Morganella morganii]MBT0307169.1 putative phage tail assembly chaperone [Morganella morganii subsp. morganii]MDU3417448.1 putative phage tail assembly chaperone [Morganella morganii]MDU3447990.1 putative phage tail assembly chaperone [Morganella morganii]MDU3504987.1 putative phage tail assembly chaperone [Morganella morganii]